MKPLLVIVGPTASGKSALATEIARKVGGEIVSCDSMQVFRECDIVTAKPTLSQRAAVPHHLLDICDPNQLFSAANWAQLANADIESIESRGKTPIVCGGTGFYLRALLQPHVLASVAPNAILRAQLEDELAQIGAEKMHAKLAQHDENAAQRLEINDSFRVLRALEVALSTSSENFPQKSNFPIRNAKIWALDWPRERLYERINARVEQMIQSGARQELQNLREKWGESAPALGGVGYKQMAPALENPDLWPDCVENWKRDTRRYAKRQLTWFRHQTAAIWLDGRESVEALAQRVCQEASE